MVCSMDFANYVPPLPVVPKMFRISHQIYAKTASLQANLPVLRARGQVMRQVMRPDGDLGVPSHPKYCLF